MEKGILVSETDCENGSWMQVVKTIAHLGKCDCLRWCDQNIGFLSRSCGSDVRPSPACGEKSSSVSVFNVLSILQSQGQEGPRSEVAAHGSKQPTVSQATQSQDSHPQIQLSHFLCLWWVQQH